jgi:hypothetical protein
VPGRSLRAPAFRREESRIFQWRRDMKKNIRRLQLCRETLHFLTLGDSGLRNAKGGLVTYGGPCTMTAAKDCTVCTNTCPTVCGARCTQ